MFGPTGLTLTLLLELIRAQKVSARMADSGKRLHGIIVSHADLSAIAAEIRNRRGQEHGYPVHQLGKVLFPGRPIKSSVVKKWIAAGLLKARKAGRARMVAAAEVEQFRLEYCLAEEACRILDISRSTLSRWEVGRTFAASLWQAGHSRGRLFALSAGGPGRVVAPPRRVESFIAIAIARSFVALCGGWPGVLSFLEPLLPWRLPSPGNPPSTENIV